MKRIIPPNNKSTFLRIVFSIAIFSLTISILTPLSFADTGSQPQYRLYTGDIRESSNKPDIIAYANTQEAAPPPEFNITVSGKCWRYHEWVSVTEKGSWISATTTIPTDCLGVQLWGDQTDGWARITVDGSEVCRVNTYGKSGKYPGEAFAYYLEIYNLPMAEHTVVAEVLGINGAGGGPDVTVYYFGLRKATATAPSQPAPVSTHANASTPEDLWSPSSIFTKEEWTDLIAKSPAYNPQVALERQKEDNAEAVLKAAGLPVLNTFFEPTDAGEKVLVVVLDFDKLPLENAPGAFITAAVQSLVNIASIKTLDISGISYVTVALQDSKERIIIEAGARASDIDALRNGKMTQTQFISKVAAQVVDRFAAWDAKNKGTQ